VEQVVAIYEPCQHAVIVAAIPDLRLEVGYGPHGRVLGLRLLPTQVLVIRSRIVRQFHCLIRMIQDYLVEAVCQLLLDMSENACCGRIWDCLYAKSRLQNVSLSRTLRDLYPMKQVEQSYHRT
jgi:hypothetical protein